MTPKVSIITPCYNHGRYIDDAIQSVEQLGPVSPWELIVVDDGSTDGETLLKMMELERRGYRVIRQANAGLAAARNTAIRAAKAPYLLPLDCDNRVRATYLTVAVELLDNHPEIDVVYANPLLFGDKSGVRAVGDFDFPRMVAANKIDACALFRRSAWERVGGYDGRMPKMGHEDWELWLHIFLTGGKFSYLNETAFEYRVVADSMTATSTYPGLAVNRRYIYEKHRYELIKRLVRERSLMRFFRVSGLDTALALVVPEALWPEPRRSARRLDTTLRRVGRVLRRAWVTAVP